MTESILTRWSISEADFTQLVDENPSLRGFVLGYLGEFQLRKFLRTDTRLSQIKKYDDHDRTKKHDLSFFYKGKERTVEVKSLQTAKIKDLGGGKYFGKFQCDASDSRNVKLPNGETVKATSLLVGEFDVLAVNMFGFRKKWDYAFALNTELPRSVYKGYTEEQRQYLLATMMDITFPPKPPFYLDLSSVLDRLK